MICGNTNLQQAEFRGLNVIQTIADAISESPAAIMMIGLPGCGKSTFVSALRQRIDLAVINMDAFRELICTELGIRYEDSMVDSRNAEWAKRNHAIHAALMQMMDMMAAQTVASGRSLVWDRVNLTRAQRQERFAQTPGYRRIGVYMQSTLEDCLADCARREAVTGKRIVPALLRKMAEQFEKPDDVEFDILMCLPSLRHPDEH